MFAVIETGGKQYRVQEGDVIFVEKLDALTDDKLKFDVLIGGEGEDVKIGNPTVQGAVVEGTVLGHGKGKKVVVFKYKSKKTYRNTKGHRQPYTKIAISKIAL